MINRLKISLLFLPVLLFGQGLVFNEVMYDPAGSEYYDEYIEIYNCSSLPLNLSGMKLKINDALDSLDFPQGDSLLPANSYLLIMDRGYLAEGKSTYYNGKIPESTNQVTIFGNSFGLVNSTPSTLWLISAAGDTIDKVTTTIDQEPGYSDEKIFSCESGEDNWGNAIILDGTPGFENSIAPLDYDLAITDFSLITPESELNLDLPVNFQVVIKNTGLNLCFDADIVCAFDKNNNNKIEETEIWFTSRFNLEPEDSVVLSPVWDQPVSGISNLMAEIRYADEDSSDNKAALVLRMPFPQPSLIVNEFMYIPLAEQGTEWVELLNVSDDSVNLATWQIGDANTQVTITSSRRLIAPDDFVVISKTDAVIDYWDLDSAIVIVVDALPIYNNAADSVVLRDCLGNSADALYYLDDWGYQQGVSLERKNPFLNSQNPGNWGLSESESGATPTRENSIIMASCDLGIYEESVSFFPAAVSPGDSLKIRFTVENCGQEVVPGFSMEIRTHTLKYLANSGQLLTLVNYPDTLQSLESVTDSVMVKVNFSGSSFLHFRIEYAGSTNPENNEATVPVKCGYAPGSLKINEFMPLTAEDMPEWLEVYNPLESPVNLRDLMIKDATDNPFIITENTVQLPPDSFAVIAADESFSAYYPEFHGILLLPEAFPTLNNSADSVVLVDAAYGRIDQIYYDSDWKGTTNISFERINPFVDSPGNENWGTCADEDGATPGFRNSIMLKDYDLKIDSVAFQQENLTDGDSLTVYVFLSNYGLQTLDNYDLFFYLHSPENENDVVISKSLFQADELLSGESVTEEFYVDSLPGGVWNMFIQCQNIFDQLDSNNYTSGELTVGYHGNPLIVNELMYTPGSGEAEWVELLNISDKTIDLNQWQIRDANHQFQPICETKMLILPNDYLVITNSVDFTLRYPDFEGNVRVLEEMPSLNNSSDSLFITDGAGISSDDVYYQSQWGGGEGISIERRNPFAEARDSSNWGSCLADLGGTPGAVNSILKYNYDLIVIDDEFAFLPEFAKPGEKVNFSVNVHNSGIYKKNYFNAKLYLDRNNDENYLSGELVWQLQNIPVPETDESILVEGSIYAENSGENYYHLEIIYESEENQSDNSIDIILPVSYESGVLTINEFHACPSSEQCEYIEIFNPGTETVNLKNWQLANNRKTTPLSEEILLEPNNFLVLIRDSSFYDYYPPENAQVLLLSNWPGLNNTSDKILLKDLTNLQIDSLFYTDEWQIAAGKSLEKFLPDYPSQDKESWFQSEDEIGGTPGKINSVTPFNQDLTIPSITLNPSTGDSETRFTATINIQNVGLSACEQSQLKIYEIFSSGTIAIDSATVSGIQKDETKGVERKIGPLAPGHHEFLAVINWPDDLNRANDSSRFDIHVSYSEKALCISEFMPIPSDIYNGRDSQAEFLEVYNSTDDDIDISGWKVSDANTAWPLTIVKNVNIQPKGYFVVASDSSIFNYSSINDENVFVDFDFPALNDSEDKLFLFDPSGMIVDSLVYNGTDYSLVKNYSQEKIYLKEDNIPGNWRKSVAETGATPGIQNSVAVTKTVTKAGFTLEPNPFTPNGDGVDDETGVYYNLPFPSAKVSVEIYDLESRLIYTVAKNREAATTGVIFWDGSSDFSDKARVGMYIVRLTATDTATGKVVGYIQTVVRAR